MTAFAALFPRGPSPSTKKDTQKAIIETVGVEVLEVPVTEEGVHRAPANGNDVIPFASTLRRVG